MFSLYVYLYVFVMAVFHVLFSLTYTVTTNAYKVTARIVLVLSH